MFKKLAILIIETYQRVFSFDSGIFRVLAIGGACKYEVSCSQFTKQQIIKFGLAKGSWLGFKRILSCR